MVKPGFCPCMMLPALSPRAGVTLVLEDGADTEESYVNHRPTGPSPRSRIRMQLEEKLQQAMAGDSQSSHLFWAENQGNSTAKAQRSDESKLLQSFSRGRRSGVTLAGSIGDHDSELGGRSPRRSLMESAAQWYEVGNYKRCEDLLDKALAQEKYPQWEILNKRAAAREKLSDGRPIADTSREYCVLGDGWLGLGEYLRAASCFEAALAAPGEAAGGRNGLKKRWQRALHLHEMQKPMVQTSPPPTSFLTPSCTVTTHICLGNGNTQQLLHPDSVAFHQSASDRPPTMCRLLTVCWRHSSSAKPRPP
jgi:hypothetical protein